MIDRKTESKRLVIFLVITFAITWGLFFLPYIHADHIWGVSTNDAGDIDSLVSLAMLVPTLGMLLTRYITKEGFAVTGKDSMMLGMYFKDKKWRYLLLAVLLPFIYTELGCVIRLVTAPEVYDKNNEALIETIGSQRSNIWIIPIALMISGIFSSFTAFGEEEGWRGYMMPKMINLWGFKKAVLIGGFVWGMWHWPLTYAGHNFGTGYIGYPYAGFLAMSFMCIMLGTILTYITLKSGSIWPASIMHAVSNAGPSILMCFIDSEKARGWHAQSVLTFPLTTLPMLAFAVFFFVRYAKVLESGKKENEFD